jgi:hypothetical protein
MIDGVKRPVANSGDVLRGKTPDSLLLELPRHDSLLETAIGTEEYLLGHSTDEGMVSVEVAMMNSGEFVHRDVQNRERWGGVEMEEEKYQFTAQLLAIL